MRVLDRIIHGRAADLSVGDIVEHVDIGEVTVSDIDGRHVQIADEHGDATWVPANEIN